MGIFSRSPHTEEHISQLTVLAEEIAGLRAEIAKLTKMRDRTRELHDLEEEVEKRKREVAGLKEVHDRETRETQHKVGLLQKQQEEDGKIQARKNELALQEARLAVREDNLAAERERFEQNMTFQHEQMRGEVDRVTGLVGSLLERLPVIDVSLTEKASLGRTRRSSGKRGAETPEDD